MTVRFRFLERFKASHEDEKTQKKKHEKLAKNPKFSIVVPLYNSNVHHLQEMIKSVEDQVYENWELILVNGSPDSNDLKIFLSSLSDEKIKIVTMEENRGISGNTNAGIEVASSDYVAFLDHDDMLNEEALYSYAMLISEDEQVDAIYSDQDFIDEAGNFVVPLVKPCLSIDFLRCQNYISHFLAVKTDLAKTLLMRSEYDGAQDYDFILRVWENTKNIHHVKKVLYHWRITQNSTASDIHAKEYALDAGQRAVEGHLKRCNLEAEVLPMERFPCSHIVKYKVTGSPCVSIVVPSLNGIEALKRCIVSICENTTYTNFEIIVVTNNACQEISACLEQFQKEHLNVNALVCESNLNLAEMSNFGVERSSGEFVLLLSDSVEAFESDWLEFMLGHFQRDDVGVVGAKLLFPDETVQHAGLSFNPDNVGEPVQMFEGIGRDDGAYMDRACKQQDVLAVSSACLLTSKKIFESIGGMDEGLDGNYKDMDFCLKVGRNKKYVVYEPNALLRNHCSQSHSENLINSASAHKFLKKWESVYAQGDPFADVSYF